MRTILFSFGPFVVYGYGAMIGTGLIVSYFVCEYLAEKKGLMAKEILPLFMTAALGGIAGAKILYWIVEWRSILANPGSILNLSDGFVVYGGIIGGTGAGWLYTKKRRLEFFKYFDLVMPCVALAQGFGRIGCLLAGCCYGKETDSRWFISFKDSWYAPNGLHLIPTQIYSSVLDFLHFFLLLYIAYRIRKKQEKKDGIVAACYLIFYSIGRFVLEFLRGDLERGSVGMLSTSQWIAFFTFALGMFIMMLKGGMVWQRNRK